MIYDLIWEKYDRLGFPYFVVYGHGHIRSYTESKTIDLEIKCCFERLIYDPTKDRDSRKTKMGDSFNIIAQNNDIINGIRPVHVTAYIDWRS
jgi:hypothetical protein